MQAEGREDDCFRRLVETSYEGIWTIDAQARTDFVNPRMAEMLGYRPEEMIGRPLSEFAFAQDLAALDANLHRRRAGVREVHEFCFRRKDGTPLWTILSANPIHDGQGRYAGALAMVTDISDRKRAEEALKTSEANWRSLFEHAPQNFYVLDLEGNFVFINRVLPEFRVEDVVGTSIDAYLKPEDVPRIRAVLDRVRETGQPETYEVESVGPEGGTAWYVATIGPVMKQGRITGFLTIATDITERKRMEDALRASEAKWRSLVASAPMFIVAIDREGAIRFMNRPLPGDGPALGDRIDRHFFPEGVAPLGEAIAHVLATGETRRFETPGPGNDGAPAWYQITVGPVREHATITGLMLLVNDITALRNALEEVATRKAELEQARELDRLKSNFVNAVTHELRTPLTAIVGYAEFLEDEIGGPITASQRTFVHEIEKGSKRLERLINDLLDFARLEAGTFKLRLEDADLGAKIEDALRSVQPIAATHRIRLEADLPDEPLTARMDAQRIGQVLTNLVDNAIKFTPEGGGIRVTAGREGDRLVAEVTDTGIGIAPEDLPKLFQLFSQLAPGVKKGGTGLGLSISKGIIEAHDGTITARSVLGEGSTFRFTLPIAGPPLAPDGEP